jgi:hypothetical protein
MRVRDDRLFRLKEGLFGAKLLHLWMEAYGVPLRVGWTRSIPIRPWLVCIS